MAIRDEIYKGRFKEEIRPLPSTELMLIEEILEGLRPAQWVAGVWVEKPVGLALAEKYPEEWHPIKQKIELGGVQYEYTSGVARSIMEVGPWVGPPEETWKEPEKIPSPLEAKSFTYEEGLPHLVMHYGTEEQKRAFRASKAGKEIIQFEAEEQISQQAPTALDRELSYGIFTDEFTIPEFEHLGKFVFILRPE